MNEISKALLKYLGSKWKVSDWIISHFPEHKVYLEPFFGTGAVFFKKQPSYIETINDIDGEIVNLFRVCRDSPDELAQLIEFTPFSREEFQNCYESSDDPIERARRTLVRYHQSFGSTNSSKNSWRNVQMSGGPRTATMWNYIPDSIMACCKRLKDAQIECMDAITLIERYNHKDTLIYCDPPYLRELRKKYMYKHEMDDEGHIRLLQTLLKSKSKVIISGYDNELYNEYLSDWDTDYKDTVIQMGKKRTEKIWMNFPSNNYYYTLI